MRLCGTDYVILSAYFGLLAACAWRGSRRERSDDEYFLVGRRMPALAAGLSVVASMLSSITYLAEPGEVWKSGLTHSLGKLLGIPLAVFLLWGCCIPFMMRFRFTSAYEYLEHRFGLAARRCGAFLFVTMALLWMGFVLLVLSQVVAQLSGLPLYATILATGMVATLYTTLGGLRVVIRTDLVQVAILVGSAITTIGYVWWQTGGTLTDWVAATGTTVQGVGRLESLPWFSWDPTVRATIVTVAVNMAIWHLCMHTSNQITVQRYFSTGDVRAARRSFLISSLVYVGMSVLLMSVGLAVLYFYTVSGQPIDGQLDPATQRDLIFPTFVMHHLPTGAGGALIVALLAAAMSTVDSGLNSVATVVALELRRKRQDPARSAGVLDSVDVARPAGVGLNHVRLAMVITVVAGVGTTGAAWLLTYLSPSWGIYDAIPRTFNAITGPLGGLFLIGIFLPQVRQAAALGATVCGLLASVILGYLPQLGQCLVNWGWVEYAYPEISFAWILPSSFVLTMLLAPVFSLIEPSASRDLAGLTWWTRHNPVTRPGLFKKTARTCSLSPITCCEGRLSSSSEADRNT